MCIIRNNVELQVGANMSNVEIMPLKDQIFIVICDLSYFIIFIVELHKCEKNMTDLLQAL